MLEDKVLEFTRRESDIILLTAIGHSSSDIAEQLAISAATVRTHLSNVCKKLHARNTTNAVAKAMCLGLLDTDLIINS